jgi:hypothetical protein
MLPEYTREELAAGLDAVVLEILTEAGVERPPVDAFSVARRLGITVAEDDRQQGRGRYVRLQRGRSSRPRATILIRPDPRGERRQWAVAHEIGEHSAYRVFQVWGVDPRETVPNAREEVANFLAGRLLAPTAWLTAVGLENGWDLIRLKSHFTSASHELIVRRMLECPAPVIISIFDQGSIYFRRSNVPGRVPPLSHAERQCWRTVHDRNRSEQTFDALRKIQGWPIHEEGWKREILRTEVETAEDGWPMENCVWEAE